MKRECVTCGKQSDDKKMFFELSAKVGSRFICRECASELGIKNFMSAGFHSNTGVLKQYVKIHPEAQFRLDAQLAKLGERKEEIKSELNQMVEKSTKHSGCKKHSQTKCICTSCGDIFYYGDYDVIKNAANIFHGSLYSLNQYKDLEQCPKCGSRAIKKKEVYYWVDKNGNCVDVEE